MGNTASNKFSPKPESNGSSEITPAYNKYVSTIKTPPPLIPGNNSKIVSVTLSSSDWVTCRDFIVKVILTHYKGDNPDNEKKDLSQHLDVNGWVERAYDGYNFIRGEIMIPTKFNVNLYMDQPSISFNIDTKLGPFNVNDPISAITSSLSNVLTFSSVKLDSSGLITVEASDSAQAQDVVESMGDALINKMFTNGDLIEKLVRNGYVSGISDDPPIYYKITLEYLS